MKSKLAILLVFAAALTARADLEVSNADGATQIGPYGATFNAAVVATNDLNPALSIYWGTSDGETTKGSWSNSISLGTQPVGVYSTNLLTLAQGTVYYYRAYGTNASGEAWADETAVFTTRTVAVSARSLSIDTNGVIVNQDDFADVNDLVTRDEALEQYVRRDGTTHAQALQIRGDSPESSVLTNGTFDAGTDWSWIGNASWSSTASNTVFAQGGYGKVTYGYFVPYGVYEFVRTVSAAGGTNTLNWSVGLASGSDTVTASAATITNIVRAGGELWFDVTPTHNLILDNVELRPIAGGDFSAGSAILEALHVRTRPKVAEEEVALLSDLESKADTIADGFVFKAPQIVGAEDDMGGPWTASGGGFTNATGWFTTGSPVAGGVRLTNTTYIQTPLLTNGFAELLYHHTATNPIDTLLWAEISTNLVDWIMAERTVDSVYARLYASAVPVDPDLFEPTIISNVTAMSWKYPEFALTTQDVSGVILEVGTPVGPREATPKAYVDATDTALDRKIDEWSRIAAVSVVRDGGQGYAIGSYWSMSADNIWRLHYGGQSVFWISMSGAVPPDILDFAVTSTQVTLVVRGTIGFEAHPQWTTNVTDWTTIATNDFESTYPDLADDSYTLTFAPIDAPVVWYRAITVVDEEIDGLDAEAHLTVPLDMEGNEVRNTANLWQFSTNTPADSLDDAQPRTIVVDTTNVWICVAEDFLGAGTNWLRLVGEVVLP